MRQTPVFYEQVPHLLENDTTDFRRIPSLGMLQNCRGIRLQLGSNHLFRLLIWGPILTAWIQTLKV